jgi:hypothetical protein
MFRLHANPPLSFAKQEMQAPWVVLFRPDLHQELLRLVFEDDRRTVVPTLKLSAKAVSVVGCLGLENPKNKPFG